MWINKFLNIHSTLYTFIRIIFPGCIFCKKKGSLPFLLIKVLTTTENLENVEIKEEEGNENFPSAASQNNHFISRFCVCSFY